MIIHINVHDTTRCMNVCIVYEKELTLSMASMMRDSDEMRDGARFSLPHRSGSPAEGDDDDYWTDV